MRACLFNYHSTNVKPGKVLFWVAFFLILGRFCKIQKKHTDEKVHKEKLTYKYETKWKEAIKITDVSNRTLVYIYNIKKCKI